MLHLANINVIGELPVSVSLPVFPTHEININVEDRWYQQSALCNDFNKFS